MDALSKLTDGGRGDWTMALSSVLWAERTSVNATTGRTPFELLYDYKCVLPIETEITTWATALWDNVTTREDLLVARTK